jgi:hypothetical protein
MFPTAAIAKLFPSVKLTGAPVEAAGITEASSAKLVMARDCGEALCEARKDKLTYVVEAGDGSFLLTGEKTAILVTPDNIEEQSLPEEAGQTDDTIKDAFKGKHVSDETFKRAIKPILMKGLTPAIEIVNPGTVYLNYTSEDGKMVGRVVKKTGSKDKFLIPESAEGEEIDPTLDEASAMLPAVEVNLKKALACAKDEETKSYLRKALATLATLKGKKVDTEEAAKAAKKAEEDAIEEARRVAEACKGKGGKDDEGDDEGDDEDDGDEDEGDEDEEDVEEAIANAAASILVEAGDLSLDTGAIKLALESHDYGKAIDAVAALATAQSVDRAAVCEGLRARAHKVGRKPSGKTGPRKVGKQKLPLPKGVNAEVGASRKVDLPPGSAKVNEGTSNTSANGTVPGDADAIVVTCTGMSEENMRGVADLIRDNHGQAVQDGTTLRGYFAIAEKADLFETTVKDRIPGVKTSRSGSVAKVRESVQEWMGRVRAIPVEDFTAHITTVAETDSTADFQTRVDALVEAYKVQGGKKDMARKITAINPIVKKKLGKGVSLEGVAEDRVKVTFPRARMDEFIALAAKAGAATNTSVTLNRDTMTVTIPESVADKIKGVFDGDDVAYVAA